jgi:hypothetical protein
MSKIGKDNTTGGKNEAKKHTTDHWDQSAAICFFIWIGILE